MTLPNCELCGEPYTTALHFCAPQDAHSVDSGGFPAPDGSVATRPDLETIRAFAVHPTATVTDGAIVAVCDYAVALERELAAAQLEMGKLQKMLRDAAR